MNGMLEEPGQSRASGAKPETRATPTPVRRPSTDGAAAEDEIVKPDAIAELEAAEQVRAEANHELYEQVMKWRACAPAPEWLPDELMRTYVAQTAAAWREGLDRAPLDRRRKLIQCGVRRKSSIPADSVTAGRLVELCRHDAFWWGHCATAARESYKNKPGAVPSEELVDFVEDPLGYAAASDCLREPLVLVGLMLDVDATELELIADEAAQGVASVDADSDARLRHRIEALQYELDEVNKEYRETERKLTKEAERLQREVEHLQGSAQRAGDEQLAAERAERQRIEATVAELEAKLGAAEDDRRRVEELEEQARRADDLALSLEERNEELAREHEVRTAAEQQLQDAFRQLRDASAKLRAAEEAAVPVTDAEPAALLHSLAALAGRAAVAAAERVASGHTTDDDVRLLRLAAACGEIAGAAHPEPSAAEVASDAVQPDDDRDVAAQEPIQAAPADAPDTPQTDAPAQAPAQTDDAAEDDDLAEDDGAVRRQRRRRREAPFEVRAIGGAEEIGASAILVQTRDGQASVLLDAGQRVKGEYGADDVGQFHYRVPGVDHLDAILVSHAHIDHVGSLPLLADQQDRDGDPVPIWMTEPTRDLAEIMLQDSARIQHHRVQEARALAESDFGINTIGPAYELADVRSAISAARTVEASEPVRIPNTSLVAKFLPVPHVLGSCAIHLKDTETGVTLLYTGDLGPISDQQYTLPDFGGTAGLDSADIVIMESTYGHLVEPEGRRRRTEGRERSLKLLSEAAEKALDRGGFVLLPSFSLGRTQELATLIGREAGEGVPNGRIYVGGMGLKITDVYEKYGRRKGGWSRPQAIPNISDINGWLNEDRDFDAAVAEILENEAPGYLIVSPAMLSGGWSRAFLRAMIGQERHAVVFTGYVPPHAGGIPRLSRMYRGATMRLDDENRKIECEWAYAGMSAHAPARDLRRFAQDVSRGREHTRFGLVHGESTAQKEMAAFITDSVDGAEGHSLQNNVPWRPSLS